MAELATDAMGTEAMGADARGTGTIESNEVAANSTPAYPAGHGDAPPTSRAVRLWQIIFVTILVVFVGILAFRLWDTNTTEQRADGMAPEFTFTTFEGETISLADLQGKGVVLNFWRVGATPVARRPRCSKQHGGASKLTALSLSAWTISTKSPRPKPIWKSMRSPIPMALTCRAKPRAAMELKVCRRPILFLLKARSCRW